MRTVKPARFPRSSGAGPTGPSVSQKGKPLVDLLAAIFEPAELRAFMARLKGGAALVESLPGPAASKAELALSAVSLLEGVGAVNSTLWNDLLRTKPKNGRRITTAWEAWAGMEEEAEEEEDDVLVFDDSVGKDSVDDDQW